VAGRSPLGFTAGSFAWGRGVLSAAVKIADR
jgi:hypothetical protein